MPRRAAKRKTGGSSGQQDSNLRKEIGRCLRLAEVRLSERKRGNTPRVLLILLCQGFPLEAHNLSKQQGSGKKSQEVGRDLRLHLLVYR